MATKRLRVGLPGFGRLGRACSEAVFASEDIELAGIAHRPERVSIALLDPQNGAPVVPHWTEIPRMDAALPRLPPELIRPTAHELLQHREPIVERAMLDTHAFERHKSRIPEIAIRQHPPAIVGAGWDPDALGLSRDPLQLLTRQGHTEISNRPGVSLHHSAWVRELEGVKDAPCTERRAIHFFSTPRRSYCPVESVAALEDEGHGIVMEGRGIAGRDGPPAHCILLFDPVDLDIQGRLQVLGRPTRPTLGATRGGARCLGDRAEGTHGRHARLFESSKHLVTRTGAGSWRWRAHPVPRLPKRVHSAVFRGGASGALRDLRPLLCRTCRGHTCRDVTETSFRIVEAGQ